MNMFKAVKATTVKEYLAQVPEDRKELINFLHDFIQKSAPSLTPHFAYNMLGYGSFKYKSSKGEMLDWPTVSLANQKNYVSVYICAVDNGKYVAEMHAKELGKGLPAGPPAGRTGRQVSVGKSCIRLKKLEDVNLPTLKKVIQIAAKKPGLVGVGASAKK